MRDYKLALSRVQRRILRASSADSRARACERLRQFRPEAEEEYRAANAHIGQAIEVLEKLRLELWNASSRAGSSYYAAKRAAGFEGRSDADYDRSRGGQ